MTIPPVLGHMFHYTREGILKVNTRWELSEGSSIARGATRCDLEQELEGVRLRAVLRENQRISPGEGN